MRPLPGSWGGGRARDGYCPACRTEHTIPCGNPTNNCVCECNDDPAQPEET